MSPPNKTNASQGQSSPPIDLDIDDKNSMATFKDRMAARNAEKEKAPKVATGDKGKATQLRRMASGRPPKWLTDYQKKNPEAFNQKSAPADSKPKSAPSRDDLYGEEVGTIGGLRLSSSPTNAGPGGTEYTVGRIGTVGQRESSKSAAHGRFNKPRRAQSFKADDASKPEAPQVSPKTVVALNSDDIGVSSGGLSLSSPQGGGGKGGTEYTVSLNFGSHSGSSRVGGKHQTRPPASPQMAQKGDKLIRAAKAPSKPKPPAPESFPSHREPAALPAMTQSLNMAFCDDANIPPGTKDSFGCLINYTNGHYEGNSHEPKPEDWVVQTTFSNWFGDVDELQVPKDMKPKGEPKTL